MHKIFYKNKKGFTLIEMLVSVSIIALMAGLYLANYRDTSKNSSLALAAQKLAGDIRLAQNYSLGLKERDGVLPESGWGVNFVKGDNYYTIFSDLNEGSYMMEVGEEFNRVNLPRGVTIDSISIGDSVDLENELDVVFLPPDPSVYINRINNTKAILSIKDKRGETKSILVNFFGLIEVID